MRRRTFATLVLSLAMLVRSTDAASQSAPRASVAALSLSPRTPASQPAPPPAPEPQADEFARERALLARTAPFDLRAQVPPGWFGDGLARRTLEPASRRVRLPARCHTTGGFREHCSGPRLVEAPHGAPLELALRLGLGHDATAMQLMGRRAFQPWIDAARGADPERALMFPVPTGRRGRGFGYTRRGAMHGVRHDGIDIGAPQGTPIVAARGGLVAYADNGITGMGNLLLLLHEDGDVTLYAHCRRIGVQPGQLVTRGEPVAEVGRTGFAYGSHLHFEWRQNGWLRDPDRVLRGR